MQRITTYIILAAVFFSGLLLVYRSAFEDRKLTKIGGRLIRTQAEAVYEHKGKTYYAITFTLADQTMRPGFYNGTDQHHHILSKADTGVVYTFLMDPSVATAKNVNLGVREIRFGGHIIIYKESNRSSLVAGLSLVMLALIAALLFWQYNKRVQAPRPKV